MDFDILWWHWILLGCVLLVADTFLINIYYLIWFGVAALSVGGLLALFPAMSAWLQILVFGGASALLLAMWIFILMPRHKGRQMQEARKELPGSAGVVIRFNNNDKRGDLRLQRPIGGKDVWEFASENSPAPGDRLVVQNIAPSGVVIVQSATESQ